jgi:biopolymer transport protein ExbB
MKLLLIPVFTLAAAIGASARPQEPETTMEQIARSAEQQLASSVSALDQLREQIAAEKLPMAQELTSLEDRLAGLRREHDVATRNVDQGNLEMTTIRAELKARQDELSYVGNLLDEYARTFESKVHPCETQVYGKAIEDAKAASEDPNVTMSEKFERQMAFADRSIQRLFEAVGGMRFPGVGVDLQGAVVNGTFAILGPVALFCSDAGAAGLVVPQSGSTNPLIRPLEGPIQAGLASLVQSGEGLLPLDPSRGGALKELVQKTSLLHIFEKGGPIMWPLLLASVLALGTVLERTVFLLREKGKRDRKALERLFADVERGDVESAIRESKPSRDFVVRTLCYALEHKEKSLTNALLLAQQHELKRFRRGIAILDTVITLAPLLGLLGTVTGMMGSFSLIGGELSAPGAITGGIAEALIATAFGLGIAITALLPFNILNTKLDEAQHEIESAAAQLELLVHPQVNTTVVVPAPRPHTTQPRPVPVGKE